jgi:hypothetical protein
VRDEGAVSLRLGETTADDETLLKRIRHVRYMCLIGGWGKGVTKRLTTHFATLNLFQGPSRGLR